MIAKKIAEFEQWSNRVSYEENANYTMRQMISYVEQPKLYEPNNTVVKAVYHRVKHFSENLKCRKDNPREFFLCLAESPAANALQRLSKAYENKTGAHISCNIMKYDILYKKLHQVFVNLDSSVDGFMMDVYWTSKFGGNEGSGRYKATFKASNILCRNRPARPGNRWWKILIRRLRHGNFV